MKRIAIIGGGISGLSAAFALEEKRKSGSPVEYVLFESNPRLGGVLVTDHVDGCIVEAGPDSFLTEKPVGHRPLHKDRIGRPTHRLQRFRSQNLHRDQRQARGDARWTHVHGAHQDHAHRPLAAFFLAHKVSHGGGMVSSTAHKPLPMKP
jgi:predicted NAD/FAD-dependent oxidoreductase